MSLSHVIEALEPEAITREIINNFTEKYDALQSQCLFDDIPHKYKVQVVNAWGSRALPLQLNGASGIKRHSSNSAELGIIV